MENRKTFSPDAILRGLFDVALAAARPRGLMARHLPARPPGRTIVVGAGKASASMAAAFEEAFGSTSGDTPLEGMVITRYGHGCPTRHIKVIEAAHPVPDDKGRAATAEIMQLVGGAGEDDLVVFLFSGGGSSLLAAVPHGITFEAKQNINRALLKSGATIAEINCVRKHLSAVKGGRLASLAAPARIKTLLISDVPGDDPATIASGPTVADPTTRHDALAVLSRYGIEIEKPVRDYLENEISETPKAGEIDSCEVALIATPMMALEAAAAKAEEAGVEARILGDSIEGEARQLGKDMAALALEVVKETRKKPVVLLSGGETTVTVKGNGRGGRNAEFLLSLLCALDGSRKFHAIACDTDGIDGMEEVAGAVIGPDTLMRARELGLNPEMMLEDNDAHGFFASLGAGAQVITGPTLTNVNDFRAILVKGSA